MENLSILEKEQSKLSTTEKGIQDGREEL